MVGLQTISGAAGWRIPFFEVRFVRKPRWPGNPVTGGGECEADISTAFAGKREAIVFAAGCQQKDVTLVTRGPHAELSAPVLLTSQPYDEGLDRCGFQRGLHVAGAGDRIGVLYRAYPPGRESCFYSSSAWFFAEYDLSGRRIGPARDLLLEFGLDSDDDVTLARDDDNDRYLLSWAGGGPQGAGTYYVPLEPAH